MPRHESAHHLAQKLRRLAHRDVLVLDASVDPGDEGFERPMARATEIQRLLVQRADEILRLLFHRLLAFHPPGGIDVDGSRLARPPLACSVARSF